MMPARSSARLGPGAGYLGAVEPSEITFSSKPDSASASLGMAVIAAPLAELVHRPY